VNRGPPAGLPDGDTDRMATNDDAQHHKPCKLCHRWREASSSRSWSAGWSAPARWQRT